MLLDCLMGTIHFVSVIVAVAVEYSADCANSGVEGFVAVFAVYFECVWYSADFYYHSSPLLSFLCFCKWGS